MRKIAESGDLKVALADRLTDQGKTEDARRVLRELERDDSADVLAALASAAWTDGDMGTARDLAMKARSRVDSLTNDPSETLLTIGSVLAEIPGAEEAAVETLRMAAAADPNDERCDLLLAVLLMGTDDKAAAARHLERGRAGWTGGRANFDAAFADARAQLARSRSRKGPETRDTGTTDRA